MATVIAPYEISNFDFAETTFYGYRINAATGRLTVEVINDRTAVELPANDVVKNNQYRTWIWTKNTLQFTWSSTKKTHLKMEIL
jgi:hypothetical protein